MSTLPEEDWHRIQPHVPSPDTESGLPMTSAVRSYAARTRPIPTAEEELEAAPLIYSNLNAVALKRLDERTGSSRNPALRPSAVANITVVRDDEPQLLISFRTSCPVKGKVAFTVPHRMSEPVSVLRANMLRTAGQAVHRHVQIRRNDTGEILPDDRSLLELGFRYPPLLRLSHVAHEYAICCHPPLGARAPLPWLPHLTLTDLARSIYKAFRPHDMRHVRVRSSSSNSSSDRSSTGSSSNGFLPLELTYVYPESRSLRLEETLASIGFAQTSSDPCLVHFLRTKNGTQLLYALPLTGDWRLEAIVDHVHKLEQTKELTSFLWLPSNATDAAAAANLAELSQSDDPFDDSDAEVCEPTYRLYNWTSAVGYQTLSFNPPCHDAQMPLPEPRWVSLEEDYTIPHLADVQVVPDTDVMVDFFDPYRKIWFSEIAEALHGIVGTGEQCELLTIRWVDRCGETLASSVAVPRHTIRIPCLPTMTVDTMLTLLWGATGASPMTTVLQTDSGRLLAPFETMATAKILPQGLLYASHRPRVWLGEEVLDVKAMLRQSTLGVTVGCTEPEW